MGADNYDDPYGNGGGEAPPPSEPHNYYNDAVGQLDQWYQKYLGRTPGNKDLEYGNHLKMGGYNGNQYSPFSLGSNIEQAIAGSPEAKAYAARPATAPTTPTDPKPATPPPTTPPPTPMVDPTGNIPPGYGWKGPDVTSTSFGSGFSGTLPTYTPAQITQYTPPDFSAIYAPQMAKLKELLSTPVMDQNYINNLNEQQKELALNRGQAAERATALDAAHRGVSQGGYTQATQRRNANATTEDLLRSQRDVSNTAATTNRQGFLDALGMSNQTLNSNDIISNRDYGSGLQGQTAQANEYGREYQSKLDKVQTQLQRDTAFEQLRQGGFAQNADLLKFFKNLDFNYSGLNRQSLLDYLNGLGLNK